MFKYIKRGWCLVTPDIRYRLFLVFLCNMLLSVTEIFGLSLILPVLALLVNPELLETKPWLNAVYEFFGFKTHENFIYFLLGLMFVTISIKNIGSIVLNRWQFKFLANAQAIISKKLFMLYMRMPYLNYLKRDIGFFTYSINSVGPAFYSSFIQHVLIILTEIVTLTLLLLVLFATNPIVTLLVIGLLSLCAGGIHLGTTRKLQHIGKLNRRHTEKSLRLIKESFSGFKEIRVLGRGGRFSKEYDATIDILAKNRANQAIYVMYTRHILEIVLVFVIVLVAVITISTQNTAEAIGQLSLFGVISFRILPSATRIISSLQVMKTAEAPLDLLHDEISDSENWHLEPEEAMNLPVPGIGVQQVNLSLRNVEFAYDNSRKNVLSQINMVIPFGTIIGIAGPSGAGKSTLADLILGILQPNEGSVLFNGKDIQQDLMDWRQRVAYVPQNIAFVSGTLKDNVALGLDAAEIDEKRVIECLRTAQLGDKLDSLDAGIEHILGESASSFSGGEKQRIGVARALYQNASVLILDEATSSLDVETESKLTEIIQALRGERTIIIIAHRLSTLQDCDKIIYMDEGKLLAADTFQNLYNDQQGFRRMVDISKIDPRHLL